jgi:hypothetical protein
VSVLVITQAPQATAHDRIRSRRDFDTTNRRGQGPSFKPEGGAGSSGAASKDRPVELGCDG